jgi:hypothetical protein
MVRWCPMKHSARIIWACAGLLSACGSSHSPSPGQDAGSVDAMSRRDAALRRDGPSGAPDAAPSCVPAVPSPSWTSPYAQWTRGIPTATSFFPIAAWLQGPWHAQELRDGVGRDRARQGDLVARAGAEQRDPPRYGHCLELSVIRPGRHDGGKPAAPRSTSSPRCHARGRPQPPSPCAG